MAEAIGLASGLLTLATFAFQSSVTLLQTVQSFQSHPKRVRDLVEELQALKDVLGPLAKRVKAANDETLSALDLPLLRCGNSCKDFEREILKCSSRTGGDRSSFRDWARLRYMRDDIDGFRRLLAGYKQTINIALTDATLSKSSYTVESLQASKDLAETASIDLKAHLDSIEAKLESFFGQSAAKSDAAATEQQLMKEEKLSTERCLQICVQLSEHIGQLQQEVKSTPGTVNSADFSEAIVDNGLQKCKESLNETAAKLEMHMQDLMGRLVDKTKNSVGSDDAADLLRLRDEWEATRRGVRMCSQAEQHFKQAVSDIENYATGDAIQFMVSTNGKVIHGKNQGLGWRTRQVGGYLSDASIQQISRDMVSAGTRADENKGNVAKENLPSASDSALDGEGNADFDKFGRGFKLKPKPESSATVPSNKPAEGG